MSYQIYYKIKVFKDEGQLFVFSLDGSNNCFFINRRTGYQVRERDWHLMYRGTPYGFSEYIYKIFKNDGVAISGNTSLTVGTFIALVMHKRKQDISKIPAFFNKRFEMFNYEKQRELEKEGEELIEGKNLTAEEIATYRRPASTIDLYNLLEDHYFHRDSEGWSINFVDEKLGKMLGRY